MSHIDPRSNYFTFIYRKFFFIKWANPGLFLFVFVLFKHKNRKKLQDSNMDRWIRRLTTLTTNAHCKKYLLASPGDALKLG